MYLSDVAQPKSRLHSRRFVCQLVIDGGDLGAQPAEVERRIGDEPLFFEAGQFPQQALALAQGKDGDEDGSVVFQRFANGGGETAHLGRAGVVLRAFLEPVGTLHDEDINAAFRESCPGNDGLVVELDVAGIENGCSVG